MIVVPVAIRSAVPSDCQDLLGLIVDHAAFEGSKATISHVELAALLEGDNRPVQIYVASSTSVLIGYSALTLDFSLWRGSRWAHLDCLFVREQYRSMGAGASLLRHAANLANQLGADRVEWQTPEWNHRAIAFYRREGAVGEGKMRFCLAI